MPHIPFSSPSPTLYDFLGIPNEEVLDVQDDGDLAHEQDLSTPDSDTKQEASKPMQIVGTRDEDEAIQFLLRGGSSPEQIVQFVKVHKSSKEAGNHAALDIISGVQMDELPGRIHTVGQYSWLNDLAKLICVRSTADFDRTRAANHTCNRDWFSTCDCTYNGNCTITYECTFA